MAAERVDARRDVGNALPVVDGGVVQLDPLQKHFLRRIRRVQRNMAFAEIEPRFFWVFPQAGDVGISVVAPDTEHIACDEAAAVIPDAVVDPRQDQADAHQHEHEKAHGDPRVGVLLVDGHVH